MIMDIDVDYPGQLIQTGIQEVVMTELLKKPEREYE
jgi:hypothetical protein